MTMTTLTASASALGLSGKPAAKSAAKPGFFGRVMAAMIESRQRKAEIEVRRVRALIEDSKPRADYALLPFAGE
jgi:hypothetical protein